MQDQTTHCHACVSHVNTPAHANHLCSCSWVVETGESIGPQTACEHASLKHDGMMREGREGGEHDIGRIHFACEDDNKHVLGAVGRQTGRQIGSEPDDLRHAPPYVHPISISESHSHPTVVLYRPRISPGSRIGLPTPGAEEDDRQADRQASRQLLTALGSSTLQKQTFQQNTRKVSRRQSYAPRRPVTYSAL